MSYPKVSIIILNWNGWKDTIECLESLYQITYQNYDVIVVDNGSEDESIEKIKEYCEGKIEVASKFFEYDTNNKPIKIIEYIREEAEAGGGKEHEIADLPSNKKLILIKNEKNYGFAEGNNIGMRYAMKALSPDYILLLNNDTVVDKRFLDELVKVAESDEKIGAIQSKLLKKDDPKTIDSLGQEIFSDGIMREIRYMEIDINSSRSPVEIFGVCAAAALYKVDVLRETGLFNKDFFATFEDVDLSWRIRLKSYNSYLSPSSIVYHKRGISGKNYPSCISPIKYYYSTANALFLSIKYYPTLFIVKFFPTFLTLFILGFLYSFNVRETKNFLKLISKNIKNRKSIQLNLVIKEIQDKWIIKISLASYFKKLVQKVIKCPIQKFP